MKRILATKLQVPQQSFTLLSRPRLLALLQETLERRLALVVAPAGFGKSTLVSHWASEVAASRTAAVAWLTLDANDDEPSRFWTAIILALQTVDASLGHDLLPLPATLPSAPDYLLTPLLHELAEWPDRPIVLILDNYHTVNTPSIHESLAFLVGHLPPHVHLVLTSRHDPPLPLARLRARGQMVELRAGELRFTPEEAGTFLNEVMRLALPAETSQLLEARTEGWIAGLQLAALAMRSKPDRADFVRNLTGTHHFVMDFLVEEVLQHQSEQIRRFLLQTSILNQLCGPLCDAVTEGADASGVLEQLSRANLFLSPIDAERRWYRYHQLFAEMLRARLQSEQPDALPRLHGRASEWYLRNAENETLAYGEALRHALAAGDEARAIAIIDQQAERLWETQELSSLALWLEALPEHLLRAHPHQAMRLAQILVMNGRFDRVPSLLDLATEAVERGGLAPAERDILRGKIATVRSHLCRFSEQYAEAIALAEEALELLPESERHSRSVAAQSLASAYHMQGNLEAAAARFQDAIALTEHNNDRFMEAFLRFLHARLLEEQGNLDGAEEAFRQLLRRTTVRGRRLPVAGWALIGLGNVAYARYELPLAESLLLEGLELARQGNVRYAIYNGLRGLLRVHVLQGEHEKAQRLAQQFVQEAEASRIQPVIRWAAAIQAAVNFRTGNLEETARWMYTVRPRPDVLFFMDKPGFALLLRMLLAQGQSDRAIDLATQHQSHLSKYGHVESLIDMHLVKGTAFLQKQERAAARAELDAALALAAPSRFVRPFADAGSAILALLPELTPEHPQWDFVRHLLNVLAERLPTTPHQIEAQPPKQQPVRPVSAPEALVEPLSEREVEVLGLIAAGLSNRQIATRLVISVPTVKKHSSNIYGKLQVQNRTQAVARARALGLLPR